MAWFEARLNQLFAPVAWLLLWDVHCLSALERWRQRYRTTLGTWLNAVAELEALSSLATYTLEHPTFVFLEVVNGAPNTRRGCTNLPIQERVFELYSRLNLPELHLLQFRPRGTDILT